MLLGANKWREGIGAIPEYHITQIRNLEHELRNAFMDIIGNLDLIDRIAVSNPTLQRQLAIIENFAKSSMNSLDRLRDISLLASAVAGKCLWITATQESLSESLSAELHRDLYVLPKDKPTRDATCPTRRKFLRSSTLTSASWRRDGQETNPTTGSDLILRN